MFCADQEKWYKCPPTPTPGKAMVWRELSMRWGEFGELVVHMP